MSAPSRAEARHPLAWRSLIASPSDLGLALRMLGWTLSLPLLVRAVPLARLVPWISRRPSAARDLDRERRLVGMAVRLSNATGLADGGCLSRSLLLYRYLGAAGARPRLTVGVARAEGRTRGHAWVTVDGRALAEPGAPEREFTRVFEAGGEESAS